jgi:hypothetical protein
MRADAICYFHRYGLIDNRFAIPKALETLGDHVPPSFSSRDKHGPHLRVVSNSDVAEEQSMP